MSTQVKLSFLGSVIFHTLLLFAGGAVFIAPPQYGIDLGSGGLEIQIIGPQAEMNLEKRSKPEIQKDLEPAEDLAEMMIPVSKSQDKKEARESNGSPISGPDPVTFFSSGGAFMEGAANHMKNPAPAYPQASIEQGQEGLVMIDAVVNREGRVKEIELKKSSGYPLLDKSALKTLKKWKFNPGRIGFLAHEARIAIPVRFRLEDEKKN